MEATHQAAEHLIHEVEDHELPAMAFMGAILAMIAAIVAVFAWFRVNPAKLEHAT
jgi:hypothetical protein